MSIRLNYQTAELRVCVDSLEGGRITGRIVGRRLSRPFAFTDICDLITKSDALMDAQSYPQAFRSIRSFTSENRRIVPAATLESDMMDPAAVEAARGDATTFSLQVFTRQNASWQGCIDFLDGSPALTFESVLELIKLMAEKLGI